MYWMRVGFGALLIALFVWMSICNWRILLLYILYKRRSSLAPFVGGLVGMAGFLVMPFEAAATLWWVPLVLDPGCVPVLVWTPIGLAWLAIRWFRGKT